MNAAARRVGIALMLLMLILAGQLTYLQLIHANALNRRPDNFRIVLQRVRRDRGTIVTADGTLLARSVPSKDEWKFRREYLHGPEYASITGYASILYDTTGVESSYDTDLAGSDIRLNLGNLGAVFQGKHANSVVLSIDSHAQDTAMNALAGQNGSVVALDVQTGAVVAMYSNPTYDPNLLASHNVDALRKVHDALVQAPGNPLRPRAYRERFPPGSTFKVITTAVALAAGAVNQQSVFPVRTFIPLPLTTPPRPLFNFGREACGGSLADSFRVSCNTTFASIGLQLGDQLATGAQTFALNGPPPPIDLDPGAVSSVGPRPGDFKRNQPQFALDAIGQGDVAVSPLQMALVAESVATGGRMLVPYVVQRVQDGSTPPRVLRQTQKRVWRTVMDPTTAATLTQLMIGVVDNGTGTAAQIPGVQVAGKTGTAETVPNEKPHAWFIGFAPADHPRYAVAVLVEHGGSAASEVTGGRVAAPIARQVLMTLLGLAPTKGP